MGLEGGQVPAALPRPALTRPQVLDDSTKEEVRTKVDTAAARAREEGHPVQVCPAAQPASTPPPPSGCRMVVAMLHALYLTAGST
jgi:hypothetical protein